MKKSRTRGTRGDCPVHHARFVETHLVNCLPRRVSIAIRNSGRRTLETSASWAPVCVLRDVVESRCHLQLESSRAVETPSPPDLVCPASDRPDPPRPPPETCPWHRPT